MNISLFRLLVFVFGLMVATCTLCAQEAAAPEAPKPTPATSLLVHFDGAKLALDKSAPGAGSKIEGGGTSAEGVFGNAWALSGPGITIPAKDNVDMSHGTIRFWMLDTDAGGQFLKQQRNVIRMTGGGGPTAWYMQLMITGGIPYFRLYMYPDGKYNEKELYRSAAAGDQPLRPGAWHHVTAGWDVKERKLWINVDDAIVGSGSYDLLDGASPMQRIVANPPATMEMGERVDIMLTVDELEILRTADPAIFVSHELKVDGPRQHGGRVERDFEPSRQVVTPHTPWANPYFRGPTKIAVAQPWENLREVVELAERLDVEFDAIPLTSFSATFETKGMFPYEREDMLKAINGDAQAIVLAGVPASWFDDATWAALLAAVEKGKGVAWVVKTLDEPRLVELLKAKSELPEYLKRGVTFGHAGLFDSPEKALTTVTRGKGRIVFWNTYGHLQTRYASLAPIYYNNMDDTHYGIVARMVLWAAAREPELTVDVVKPRLGEEANKGGQAIACVVNVPASMAGQKVSVEFAVRDASATRYVPSLKDGQKWAAARRMGSNYPVVHVETKPATLTAGRNELSFKLPEAKLPGGYYSADCRVLDEAGKVIDWDCSYLEVAARPRIFFITPAERAYEPGKPAQVQMTFDQIDNAPKNVTLTWKLYDTFDRVLLQGEAPWNGTTQQNIDFTVPARPQVMTKGLYFTVAARRGETLVYQAKPVFFLIPGRREKAFYYVAYGMLAQRMGEVGFDTISGGPDIASEPLMVAQNADISYWMGVPGLRIDPAKENVRKPSFSDPAWKAEIASWFEKLGPLLARQKASSALVVDEWEYAHWRSNETMHDLDHHPASLAAFREFLKADYQGSLPQLNQTWGTSYANWDNVEMKLVKDVDVKTNAAPLVDRLRFIETVIADTLGFLNDEARKYDPQARLGLSGTRAANGFNGYDYWKISQSHARGVFNYSGPMPEESTSFAKPGDFLSVWSGYGSNYRDTAGEAVWERFILGDEAFVNYCAWPDYGSHIVDWRIAPGTAAYRKVFEEIDAGIAELVRHGKRQSDPVAIHYSQATIHAARLGLVPLTNRVLDDNLNSLIQLMEDCGIAYRFVSYAEIEQGELTKGGFKVLLLPLSAGMSAREAKQIKAFAEGGGTVIADAIAGLYDQHGKSHGPRGTLDNFFGIQREGAPNYLNQSGKLTLEGKTVTAIFGEPGIKPAAGAKAEAAITFQNFKDVPAVISNAHGKGRSVYLNATFADYNVIQPGGIGGEVPTITLARAGRRDEAQSFMRSLLARGGVTPAVVVKATPPPKVEKLETLIARYQDGKAMYFLVQANHAGAESMEKRRQNPATIKLPDRGFLYDIRTGKSLGEGDEVKCTLTEGEPQLIAVLPAPVTGVKITADAKAQAGKSVQYAVKVESSKPAHCVIHVTVTGPDGKPRPAYTANIHAPNGAGKGTIAFALSDTPGTWTIHARDVSTGSAAEAKIEVSGL